MRNAVVSRPYFPGIADMYRGMGYITTNHSGDPAGGIFIAPNGLPAARLCSLFNKKRKVLVWQGWSDADGSLTISNLTDGLYQLVIDTYPSDSYDGVLVDNLRPYGY